MAANDENVLIVRVWFEETPAGFRARMIYDVDRTAPTTAVFANPDTLLAAVGDWVRALPGQVSGGDL
jgi:hypothetical protein